MLKLKSKLTRGLKLIMWVMGWGQVLVVGIKGKIDIGEWWKGKNIQKKWDEIKYYKTNNRYLAVVVVVRQQASTWRNKKKIE